jgi:hypothetical protein
MHDVVSPQQGRDEPNASGASLHSKREQFTALYAILHVFSWNFS